MRKETGTRVAAPIAALSLFILLALGCQPADEEPAVDAGEPLVDEPARVDEQADSPEEITVTAEAGVTASMTEWAIELEPDTVPAGPTTFRVLNRGDVVHALEVEGNGMEWVTDRLQPGQEAILETELEPGTYEVYCPVVGERGDHSEMGMMTTITVEGM